MDRESTLAVQLQTTSAAWVDVGHLHQANNRNWFEFDDSYWNLAHRPVLGQIFEEHGRAWKPSARVALPHWFSHLLPEGRLRQAVAAAAHSSEVNEFDLLRLLGPSDLPGAIRVVLLDSQGNLTTMPDEADDEDADRRDDPILKFSLAGVQLKFSIYGDERGLTVPVGGQAGNFILKFPDGRPGFTGVPEAELGCILLAQRAGIDAVSASIISPYDVDGLKGWAQRSTGKALLVKRFDRREDDVRIHMEELAQVVDVPTAVINAKYTRANFETIGVLIGALCGVESIRSVIDRIVLNVIIGNGDAHLKNWAIQYIDGRTPTLSPLYDVLPTVLYIPKDNLGLNLDKSKSFEAVTPASFDRLGSRTGFGVTEARKQARDAAERILSHWNVLADYLSLQGFANLSERRERLGLLQ